ncbi:MAG: DUF1284 domain-containing protein [Bacillota bacterium]
MKRIRLRGHHLLCLEQFRGLGYSPSFVANFVRVRSALGEPGVEVELTDGADAICAACPFIRDGACGRDTGVYARDRLVLARLGLAAGARLPFAALRELLAAAFPPGTPAPACAGCTWLAAGVCYPGQEEPPGPLK